jgi:hypothetical protein
MNKSGRKKRTEIQNLQEGNMKNIAKLFFLDFITKSKATQKLYSDRIKNREALYKKKLLSSKGYVASEITKRVNEWLDMGFLEISNKKKQYYDKDNKKEGKPAFAYRMNLNPLFHYCKKEHNIEFTEEENYFLYQLFFDYEIRERVIQQFPEEDIINAILKYYVQNFIQVYNYLLRFQVVPENKEMQIKINKAKQKAEGVNARNEKLIMQNFEDFKESMLRSYILSKGKTEEDFRKDYKKTEEAFNQEFKKHKKDFMDILADEDFQELLDSGFLEYKDKLKNNRSMVLSVDKKFLTALRINPFIF